jgi:cell division protein FtsL
MNSRSQGKSPTVWMVLTAVFALAAVGLGIWAITTNSDLDDAEATIEQQRRQLASGERRLETEERRSARVEQAERAFGRRAVRAYRRVRRRLVRARGEERELRVTIDKEAGELNQARREVANAESAEAREAASLQHARERADVAAACARGTLDAIDEFFNAASAEAGANRAMRELERLRPRCESALQ